MRYIWATDSIFKPHRHLYFKCLCLWECSVLSEFPWRRRKKKYRMQQIGIKTQHYLLQQCMQHIKEKRLAIHMKKHWQSAHRQAGMMQRRNAGKSKDMHTKFPSRLSKEIYFHNIILDDQGNSCSYSLLH